ncbi:ABC transporter ATP-binding protein [Paenibacillus sp. P96]|uniref:ABC transporter ATP-binding protein n=1 Tax=Paenibacillus zeirhizosphaerae TaxID=2987519 RepID=A0ABT9FQX5_9BACL|nr:ABC transporter ATP-binding protein [Paenibacillus sp. P96]MDP4097116.1 ABC transporter ATP-binding protein [Paenibacillus sp. P96]
MEIVIQLEQVSYRREQSEILKNMNWTVKKGEHWALLGLNGSGKTTILNLINGYIWSTLGKVSVLGELYGTVDVREMRKRIGWVSSSLQEKLHSNDKTQNIIISGKHASIGLYEQTTDQEVEQAFSLMTQLGCGHLFDRSYQSCSQGEKQKLLIARALMAEPRILILDEATNGLDFLSRESLLASIQQIAEQPEAPTILYVTHHIEEIMPVFNQTMMIRRGEVFRQGPSTQVLTNDTLSSFFETEIQVQQLNNRAWISIP